MTDFIINFNFQVFFFETDNEECDQNSLLDVQRCLPQMDNQILHSLSCKELSVGTLSGGYVSAAAPVAVPVAILGEFLLSERCNRDHMVNSVVMVGFCRQRFQVISLSKIISKNYTD